MMLLAVILTKRSDKQAERLCRLLTDTCELIHNKGKIQTALYHQKGLRRIEVTGVLPEFKLITDGGQIFADMSKAIAEYLVAEEEEMMLRSLIKHEFHYDQEEDINGILGYCHQMLKGTGEWADEPKTETDARHKRKITEELTEFLAENTELNLDGILRFRLQAYRNELREVVEYAIDEFIMDQQYQEFIALLQYFVFIQEAKIPSVHLLHKEGSHFMLFNDQMEQINTDHVEAVVTVETLDKDMNFEDMIVSTLITVSPAKIFIHTREPGIQVIKTISQIFENRVEICEYCRLCQNLDRSTAGEYNKG